MSIKDHPNSALEIARKFQNDLLSSFPRRKDALLQTVEALASMIKPSRVVELSQAMPFQRTYSNIQKAIDGLCPTNSGYTSLKPMSPNQIVIARGRIDRTGRRPYRSPESQSVGRGRPKKYEKKLLRFSDNIPAGDEGGPDEEIEYESICNGRQVFVFLSRWNSVHVHGQTEPVDVVKCEIFLKEDTGRTLFEKPLLLITSGQRRRELTSLQIYQSYRSRFDIEHFFRFQKQQLLFSGYQTPDLRRQVSWWWLCLMAYWLLYLVRAIAPESNRPWMPRRRPNMTASPGEVKRVFGLGIFPNLGSPSRRPLPRGKSQGRTRGMILAKRERKKPIKKAQKSQHALAA